MTSPRPPRIPRRSFIALTRLWQPDPGRHPRLALHMADLRRTIDTLRPQLPLAALRGQWPAFTPPMEPNLTDSAALAQLCGLSLPGEALTPGEYAAWLAWADSPNPELSVRAAETLSNWVTGLTLRQLHLTGQAEATQARLPGAATLALILGYHSEVLDSLKMRPLVLSLLRRQEVNLPPAVMGPTPLGIFLYARHDRAPTTDLYAEAERAGWTDPMAVHAQLKHAGDLWQQSATQLLPPQHRPARWSDALSHGLIAQTIMRQDRFGWAKANQALADGVMDDLLASTDLLTQLQIAVRALNTVAWNRELHLSHGGDAATLTLGLRAAGDALAQLAVQFAPDTGRLLWLLIGGAATSESSTRWPLRCAHSLIALSRQTTPPDQLPEDRRRAAVQRRPDGLLPQDAPDLLATAAATWLRRYDHTLIEDQLDFSPEERHTLLAWQAALPIPAEETT